MTNIHIIFDLHLPILQSVWNVGEYEIELGDPIVYMYAYIA